MLSAPMARNFIAVANQSSPLRRGAGYAGGVVIVPHPPSHEVRHPPPQNHPRDASRGARCGGGHFRTRRFVFYSMAQGCSNSYVPVVSVYDTPTGAYIIHDPPGLDARQLVAVPADI